MKMNKELEELAGKNRCTAASIKEAARKIAKNKPGVNETYVAFDILRYCRYKNGSSTKIERRSEPGVRKK
ncbi:MAG: hypothetical protein JWR43_2815 [Phenylobacterium sp.]|jgi:hypothetical protein|nr:hypothetical protein [Phenylobacterium sp.]